MRSNALYFFFRICISVLILWREPDGVAAGQAAASEPSSCCRLISNIVSKLVTVMHRSDVIGPERLNRIRKNTHVVN